MKGVNFGSNASNTRKLCVIGSPGHVLFTRWMNRLFLPMAGFSNFQRSKSNTLVNYSHSLRQSSNSATFIICLLMSHFLKQLHLCTILLNALVRLSLACGVCQCSVWGSRSLHSHTFSLQSQCISIIKLL